MALLGAGPIWLSLAIILVVIQFETQAQESQWLTGKFSHRAKAVFAEELKFLAEPKLRVSFESLLDPMLIPRVSGTKNLTIVRDFIVGEMTKLNWDIETDAFEDNTPFGVKPFYNIITTLNPNVPRRLVLACHYDSKHETKFTFLGATDSAVPCAMLLHLAYSLNESLESHKANPANNVTLQFIFFDGEEAFVQWNSQDSIYGSRHLAAKWEQTPYPPGQRQTNELNRMDMMVLLDLIGTKNPTFLNFFQSTSHWHNHVVGIEQALRTNRLFTGGNSRNYFHSRASFGGVEDDHIPFLNRGVDILHMICTPFPSVWHTEQDNRNALDFPTIENLNRVLRVFVTSYLHLPTNNGS